MSIRILGGQAKGFLVDVPKSHDVRPTSVMLRRKIFDSFQNLEGWNFVDICCGSGAVGFEALSRGADSVVFFEQGPKTLIVLEKNIERFKERIKTAHISLFKGDFQKSWIKWAQTKSILFFDPPYEQTHLYESFFSFIKTSSVEHSLWIESDSQKGLNLEVIEELYGHKASKVFKHGSSFISIFS